MTPLSPYCLRAVISTLVSTISLAGFAYGQGDTSEEDEVFVLSPFSVNSTDNQGYRATNTIAGTRIKTEIKDLASAISVYTEAFLDDTAATNAEELLVYAAGVEVPGLAGNFSNVVAAGAATLEDDASRRQPQDNTRVRGLAAADLSRDYFTTNIPFDSYNTESITINRGSNSILFGLGSPAGIINNDLKKAYFANDAEIQFRVDSFGSARATVDINREIVEDKMAIRLLLLNNGRKYNVDPAFEDDKRIYGSLLLKPFGGESNTAIRANFESGDVMANRPRMSPPVDALSSWWDPNFNNGAPTPSRVGSNGRPYNDPNSVGYGVPNATPASYFNIGAPLWSPTVVMDGPNASSPNPAFSLEPFITGNRTFDPDGAGPITEFPVNQPSFATLRSSGLAMRVANVPFAGFYQNKQINDASIFDYNNLLLDGPNKREWSGFDTFNVTLEQLFLDKKAGIEIAFDRQNFEDGWVADIDSGRGRFVSVDTNVTLQNGLDNPNFGRPFVSGSGSAGERYVDRETVRVQGFYKLNFNDVVSDSKLGSILGEHTVTGLYNEATVDTRNLGFARYVWGPERADYSTARSNLNRHWNPDRWVGTHIYLGDSFKDASSPVGWNIQNPKVPYELGTSQDVWLFNENTQQFENHPLSILSYENDRELLVNPNGAGLSRTKISSKAGVLQSKWLDSLLVTTVGWRDDGADSWNTDEAPHAPADEGDYGIIDPSVFKLPSEVTSNISNQTWSYGAVLHVPESVLEKLPAIDRISFHYSESDNFIPAPGRVNIAQQSLPAEGGSTVERGFSMELFESKLFLKANWYKTSQELVTENNFGNVADIFAWEARMIERAPDFIAREADFRALPLFANAPPFSKLAEYVDPVTLLPKGYTPEFAAFLGTAPVDANNDGYPDRETLSVLNTPSGLVATSDVVSKGLEFETVYAPMTNWSIMFNAAQQQVIRSNSGPELQKFIAARLPYIQEFGAFPSEDGGEETFLARVNRTAITQMNNVLAQNGSPLVSEIREWRWNLATNYRFEDGIFKGFSLGGGARWQDEIAIGYGVKVKDGAETLDTDNPMYGPSELNLDLWVGYGKAIFDDKVDWKIQLNIRNLEGDDGLIPTYANPNGEIAGWRIQEPRSFVLTNTFSF